MAARDEPTAQPRRRPSRCRPSAVAARAYTGFRRLRPKRAPFFQAIGEHGHTLAFDRTRLAVHHPVPLLVAATLPSPPGMDVIHPGVVCARRRD